MTISFDAARKTVVRAILIKREEFLAIVTRLELQLLFILGIHDAYGLAYDGCDDHFLDVCVPLLFELRIINAINELVHLPFFVKECLGAQKWNLNGLLEEEIDLGCLNFLFPKLLVLTIGYALSFNNIVNILFDSLFAENEPM